MRATSWTGSELQRREHRGSPRPRKSPRFIVPEGTLAHCKRINDREWREYTTTKLLSFSRPYKDCVESYVFEREGYLLKVSTAKVVRP